MSVNYSCKLKIERKEEIHFYRVVQINRSNVSDEKKRPFLGIVRNQILCFPVQCLYFPVTTSSSMFVLFNTRVAAIQSAALLHFLSHAKGMLSRLFPVPFFLLTHCVSCFVCQKVLAFFFVFRKKYNWRPGFRSCRCT